MKGLNRAKIIGILLFFASNHVIAQTSGAIPVAIAPYEITVSYNKTTNLIFPYAIKGVDRGSAAVIVQKSKGVENILQAKAAKKDFEPTNLSIVTADGRFYSFLLKYQEENSHLNISFAGTEPMHLTGKLTDEEQLKIESWKVMGMPRFIGVKQTQQALQLRLNGIFLSDKNMWLQLRLRNFALVDFQPAYIRFFLRDRKRVRRTTIQETEIFPVYTPNYQVAKGESISVWAIGFTPFTVPKHQQLIIQVGDETGGRVIHLVVKSKFLLRAQKLPS